MAQILYFVIMWLLTTYGQIFSPAKLDSPTRNKVFKRLDVIFFSDLIQGGFKEVNDVLLN